MKTITIEVPDWVDDNLIKEIVNIIVKYELKIKNKPTTYGLNEKIKGYIVETDEQALEFFEDRR